MPNMKNAKKRVEVNKKKNEVNNTFAQRLKTAVKNLNRAVLGGNKEKANEALKIALKAVDKEYSRGISSKNKVSRSKSRLTKKVNDMK